MSSGAEQWAALCTLPAMTATGDDGRPAGPAGAPALDLGGRLRAERLGQGIGLREMARRLGISASALSQIETGKAQPSVSKLFDIVNLLGVSVDGLLAGDAPRVTVTRGQEGFFSLQRAGEHETLELESGVLLAPAHGRVVPRGGVPPRRVPAGRLLLQRRHLHAPRRPGVRLPAVGPAPGRRRLRGLRAGPRRLDQLPGDHPAPARQRRPRAGPGRLVHPRPPPTFSST